MNYETIRNIAQKNDIKTGTHTQVPVPMTQLRKVNLHELDAAYSIAFPDSTPINVNKKKRGATPLQRYSSKTNQQQEKDERNKHE